MARLLKKYREEIVPAIRKEFEIGNINAVPRIEKVCLNMGVGRAMQDSKYIDQAKKDLTLVAGQAAAPTTSKVSVSNFKLREGVRIGCRVTLRGTRMYEFLDRLMNVALPRVRDFRGVSGKGFDKQGNYSLGIEELSIFPEIDSDKADFSHGMDVTVVFKNSGGRERSYRLLKMLGMPFAE